MKKISLLLCVIITCSLFSCKKKNTDPQPVVTATDIRDAYRGTFDLIATNNVHQSPIIGAGRYGYSYAGILRSRLLFDSRLYDSYWYQFKVTLPALTFIDKTGKKQLYGIDAGSKLFAPNVASDYNKGGFASKDSINYTYSDGGVSFTSTTVVTGHRQ